LRRGGLVVVVVSSSVVVVVVVVVVSPPLVVISSPFGGFGCSVMDGVRRRFRLNLGCNLPAAWRTLTAVCMSASVIPS